MADAMSPCPAIPKASNLLIFRCVINTLNHVMIGTITFYITWISFLQVNLFSWHVFLSTVGFQTLMAEAIMTLAPDNSWSRLTTRKTKITLHWVLQVLGSGIAIAGIAIEIWSKSSNHFVSIHAITGLASLVLLCIACLNGILALFAQNLRKQIKPVISKLFHNFIGTAAFVIGMVSLMYGYHTGWMRRNSTPELQDACWWITLITMLLSLTASLHSGWGQAKSFFTSS